MTPRLKRTYIPEHDKLKYDIVCDKCGATMYCGGKIDEPFDGIPIYRYDCPVCDFHRIDKIKYPVFVDGWKERKGNV